MELIGASAGAVLATAAIGKLMRPAGFDATLRSLFSLSGWGLAALGRGFPLVEAIVGTGLFLTPRQPALLIVGSGLYGGFALTALYALKTHRPGTQPCGCLGGSAALILTRWHTRTNAIVAFALLGGALAEFVAKQSIGSVVDPWTAAFALVACYVFWVGMYAASVGSRLNEPTADRDAMGVA